jgi:iron complex transport system substrate-binding protein
MKRSCLALVAILAVLVGGCSAAGASPVASSRASGAIAVTDALGRRVAFDTLPTRIAIAGKASFMVADAVYMFPEASARVVALARATQGAHDFISVIDPAYSKKTILDPSAGVEQVAGVHPDAVILKSSNADSLGKPLEVIGIKVVYVDFETPEQYTRDLATLGVLFGDGARAQQLNDYFTHQMNRVKAAVGALGAASPRVLLLYYTSKNGSVAFQVPPLGFIQSAETESAGGELVWREAQLGSGWTTVSLEQIAAWDPDQIYVVAYFDKVADVVTGLYGDPQWQALRAVSSRSVFGFPGDYYSWDEPDPRWALGLTWLATHTHPELATSFDMGTEVRTFYTTAYGMNEAAFDTQVKPYLPAGVI